jgi:pyruvate/2-oxoglutarate dehydrogenase complex dihydrolipoamide acyltransferase (E2) component
MEISCMPTTLTIPRLEMSMTEGTLAEWLAEDGAEVREGQPIYVLETNKASQEIEAPSSGRLVRKAEPGQIYEVGREIGEIS